ncbi:MAG: thiamine diphosphokinase [Chloroflexi bacterium]|nr:thiamine diphosphokinase [Chloroflexota bacterium]
MKAVIVANGDLRDHLRLVEIWRAADLRIAADGGATNARKHLTLAPHVLIGDFDSVDEATHAWCMQAHTELIKHSREKNETDLELAIDLAIARGTTDITILGAIGGRFDQMLANAFLLVRLARARIHARIVDIDFDAWLAWEHSPINGKIGETVSLISITDRVDEIVTNGLRYPLRNETLYLGSPRGVSNELIVENASVTFKSGLLLVVHLLADSR